jgi:hypothetical protein
MIYLTSRQTRRVPFGEGLPSWRQWDKRFKKALLNPHDLSTFYNA